MAVESLWELGHEDCIEPFLETYLPQLEPLRRGRPIRPAERAAARGVPERTPDWIATWHAELASRSWQDVVREAVPPLLPGLFGAAAHGTLRVAHALRSLGRGETPPRLRVVRGAGAPAAGGLTLPSLAGSGMITTSSSRVSPPA